MNTHNVDEMQTGEIINYLREQRGYHILVNLTRDMYQSEFRERFSDLGWTDFLTFCDQLDNELMLERAEKYLAQWHAMNIIRNSFNQE